MDDPDSGHDRNIASAQILYDDQASPSSDSAQILSCGEHCTLFLIYVIADWLERLGRE
jgi:hypothetical protein